MDSCILAAFGILAYRRTDCFLVPQTPTIHDIFCLPGDLHCVIGICIVSFVVLYPLLTWLLVSDRTVQFVGISAFHTRVSDPIIGGTYMTVCVRSISSVCNRLIRRSYWTRLPIWVEPGQNGLFWKVRRNLLWWQQRNNVSGQGWIFSLSPHVKWRSLGLRFPSKVSG